MKLIDALTDEDLAELLDRLLAKAGDRLTPATTPWLDADGAAEYLATSRDRIYDLVQLGKLKPHRDGRRLLFRRSELDAYLEASA